jgi:hypothetical protein
VPSVVAEADMLVDDVAWFFVGGDQRSELQRLDRIVGCLLAVHALRSHGYAIRRVCMFQLITGCSVEWPVSDWIASSSQVLAAYIQARSNYSS